MTTTVWIILGVANIPLYFGFGWLIFSSWQDFKDSAKFWFTPEFVELFRGKFQEHWWEQLKFALWFVASIGCVIGESYLIRKLAG